MGGKISKRGQSWQVTIECGKNAEGKRIRKYFTARTKAEAETILIEHKHKIITGDFVEPSKMTFAEFLKHWMDHYVYKNCEITTRSGYEMALNKHVIPFLGKIPLQKLSPLHIQEYYKHLMDEKGLSPNTVRRHHSSIHRALVYACEKQLVNKNAADRVTLPKREEFEGAYYTEKQIVKLLDVVKGDEIEAAVCLAVYLGLRRGEICGLKWKHIDFEKQTLEVKETRTRVTGELITKAPKTKKSHRVLYLPDQLAEFLREHKEQQKRYRVLFGRDYISSDYVCTKINGEPIHPDRLSHRFQDMLEKHDLPRIRFHDIRHTVASLLLHNNIPVKNISEMLGHSDVTTTLKIYGHVLEEAKKDTAIKMADIIKGKRASS